MLILNFIHIQPEFVIEFQDGEGGGRRLKQGIRYGAHTNCRKSRYPPFTQPDTPFTFLYARLSGALHLSLFRDSIGSLNIFRGFWRQIHLSYQMRFTNVGTFQLGLLNVESSYSYQFNSFRFFHQYYCYQFSFNILIF